MVGSFVQPGTTRLQRSPLITVARAYIAEVMGSCDTNRVHKLSVNTVVVTTVLTLIIAKIDKID